MKKVIKSKLSGGRYLVEDSVGRQKVLITTDSYNVGDPVVVVNDIIIGRTKREVEKVYEV